MPSAVSFCLDTKQTGKPENRNICNAEIQPTATSLWARTTAKKGNNVFQKIC